MPRPSTTPLPAVPEGWTVQSVKYHYNILYWSTFVLGLLGQTAPDVTYRLRSEPDGSMHSISPRGDHAPGALAETLHLLRER